MRILKNYKNVVSGGAYLTTVDKIKIVNHLNMRWFAVDKAIKPYILKLNMILGLATIQSCAGHQIVSNGPVYHNNANLWLWLSEPMMKKFKGKAFKLAKVKGIERLYIMYTPDGYEYIEISFDSVEEKKRNLKAMRAIIRFFRSLEEKYGH